MRSVLPTLVIVLVCLLAAGCGQKGPLYFRDSPPAGVKPPKPEPYTPVPYPKDAGENEGTDGAKK